MSKLANLPAAPSPTVATAGVEKALEEPEPLVATVGVLVSVVSAELLPDETGVALSTVGETVWAVGAVLPAAGEFPEVVAGAVLEVNSVSPVGVEEVPWPWP